MRSMRWLMAASLLWCGGTVLLADDDPSQASEEIEEVVVTEIEEEIEVVVEEQKKEESAAEAEQQVVVEEEIEVEAPQVAEEDEDDNGDAYREAKQAYQEAAEAAQRAAREARKAAEQAAQEAREAAEDAAKEARHVAEQAYQEASEQAAKAREQAYRYFKQRVADAKSKDGYRLQISVAPVPRSLDTQLKLKGQGLLVERVGKGGPADKAGLQEYDILLSVADKPIERPDVLLEAVEQSEGEELELKVLRSGEPVVLTIVPAEAPQQEQETEKIELSFPSRELNVQIEQLEQKIREKLKNAGVDVRMQLIRPGRVLHSLNFTSTEHQEFPKDLNVEIRKEGPEPAKITVTRGEESWTVGEGELDKLPDDVRPHVAGMLGRGPMRFAIADVKQDVRANAAKSPDSNPAHVPLTRERVHDRLEHKLDQLNHDVERMNDQLHELQDAIRRELPKLRDRR
ncbi:MAG: PDZ domain-containing protein [Planctomycetota bacterium]|nr:MAG: PDZ domain-containing protein [Planctomycetota bacterium]